MYLMYLPSKVESNITPSEAFESKMRQPKLGCPPSFITDLIVIRLSSADGQCRLPIMSSQATNFFLKVIFSINLI